MASGFFTAGKIFSPRVFSKALQTFDKATMVIVASCWGGALLIMLFALYTLSLSVTAKREVATAAAKEPTLPVITSRSPELKEMSPLLDRLTRRFPEINFSLSQDRLLTVSAENGQHFRAWLTVLSYIDTISPEFRWHIKDLCVGNTCSSSTPMRAVLRAEKISFTVPSE